MEPFIGQIQAFGFNYAPGGWEHCDGQLLQISQNPSLYSLLLTTYGGDGKDTFGLPDLRGRSIVHVGNGPGLDRITWGERGGSFEIGLNETNLPSHTHIAVATTTTKAGFTPPTGGGTSANPNGAYWSNAGAGNIYGTGNNVKMAADAVETTVAITPTGGSLPFNSRNPFLGVYVSIALVGLFPPRS